MPEVLARARARVDRWERDKSRWESGATGNGGQSALFTANKRAVAELEKVIADHVPERSFVRPLLVVVPRPAV